MKVIPFLLVKYLHHPLESDTYTSHTFRILHKLREEISYCSIALLKGFPRRQQQEALFQEPLVVFVIYPVPELGRTVVGDLVNNLEIIPEHGLGDAGRFILAFNLDGDFLIDLEALIANLVHACQLAACPEL